MRKNPNNSIEADVIAALQLTEGTSDEIATLVGANILAVRPSICVLHKKGKVVKTGKRRQNETGKWANVWAWRGDSVSA